MYNPLARRVQFFYNSRSLDWEPVFDLINGSIPDICKESLKFSQAEKQINLLDGSRYIFTPLRESMVRGHKNDEVYLINPKVDEETVEMIVKWVMPSIKPPYSSKAVRVISYDENLPDVAKTEQIKYRFVCPECWMDFARNEMEEEEDE